MSGESADDKSEEDAKIDGELVGTTNEAGGTRRRNLGEEDGHNGGGNADADAAEASAGKQGWQRGAGGAEKAAKGEGAAAESEGTDTAEDIGEPAASEGANGGAKERGGDNAALLLEREAAEAGGHLGEGGVDDGEVEAKEEDAERGGANVHHLERERRGRSGWLAARKLGGGRGGKRQIAKE